MSTRRLCLLVAFLFVAAFAISLTFDWHGAIAVVFALGFFLFVTAASRHGSRRKRIVAVTLIAFSVFSLVGNPHQNLVFLATVTVGGVILFFDPLGHFLIRRDDSNAHV